MLSKDKKMYVYILLLFYVYTYVGHISRTINSFVSLLVVIVAMPFNFMCNHFSESLGVLCLVGLD